MTNINKHFNLTSNKILAVDEIATRFCNETPDDVEFTKNILSDPAEWKDAGGKLYLSEMAFKGLFSKLADAGGKKGSALAEAYFPKLQEAIDASEDHRDRLNAGRLNAGRLHARQPYSSFIMQDNVNAPAAPFTEAEQALRAWGVEFERDSNGKIVVPGNLDLGSKRLTKLPDLSEVIVRGNFSCINNDITSLVGSPQSVGGSYNCSYNNITSLKGSPSVVGGSFYCHNCELTTLEGAPKTVVGIFVCHDNHLTSLEHAPYLFKRLDSDFGTYPGRLGGTGKCTSTPI